MRVPRAAGVKVTVRVQEAPPERIPPESAAQEPAPELVMEKSPGFVPVREGLITVAVLSVPLLSVKVTGVLEFPRRMEPKLLELGVSVTIPEAAIKGCG